MLKAHKNEIVNVDEFDFSKAVPEGAVAEYELLSEDERKEAARRASLGQTTSSLSGEVGGDAALFSVPPQFICSMLGRRFHFYARPLRRPGSAEGRRNKVTNC